MRGMWAFSCLSERATHPQTAEVALQSLQPAAHPTFLLVFSAQEGGLGELYSVASGSLAEFPLSGAGNKSVTRRGGALRPSRKWGGVERPGGTGSVVQGEGQPSSPPAPMALDRFSELCPYIGPWTGGCL